MKIIVSHDVDHLSISEHYSDLIIPKYLLRSSVELFKRRISVCEIRKRLKRLLQNRWENIDELAAFNRSNDIPATFFVGVSNGRGLSYSLADARSALIRLKNLRQHIGIHGIAYDDYNEIKKEYDLFTKLTNDNQIGIRIHCLKKSPRLCEMLSEIGYLFDASVYDIKNPYRIANIWEFPIGIMDSYIMNDNSKWQNKTFEEAVEETRIIIENAAKHEIKYFSILFHDRHFDDSFSTWKRWYIWVVEYLKKNKCEFVSYKTAIAELSSRI